MSAENIKCQITRCEQGASVLVIRDRPKATAMRERDYPCWTGHMETKYCAEHGASRVVALAGDDWRFYGDVVTLRPLADS